MKFIVSRITTLWLIVSLTFVLMHILPGDPFQTEQALPKEIHASLRKHYGLDDPPFDQYFRYLKSVATWNFGPSFYYTDRSVNDIIKDGFPVSAKLGVLSLLLAISIGTIIGIFGAIYKGKWQDKAMLIGAALGISMPSFILATFLQYSLGFQLQWFPIARWGSWMHMVLPAVSLAALPAAFISRMVRSNLIEVLSQDYIRTARSKGISEARVLWVHAMRNAVLPVATYLGPLTANILAGSFVVEKIYAIPGLGQWFVNSITNRDYPVIMGLTVFYSILLIGFVLIVDLGYRYLDPRMR